MEQGKMTEHKWALSLGWLLLGAVTLPAQTDAGRHGKLPEPAAVLDRYVEVTGGASTYRKFSVEIIDTTVTAEGGQSAEVTVFRARDGRMRTVVEAGAASEQSGVANGVPWKFSEKSGARLLTGKAGERQVVLSRGFEDDTWREQFPKAVVEGEGTVNGKRCYHLNLTRTDGGVVQRFYDAQSGLLVREISTEFDDSGVEQPVTLDIEAYSASSGLKHPSSMRMSARGHSFQIKVESVLYSAGAPPDAFVVPHEVIRAMAEPKGDSALPNAVGLVDRFIELTGGKSAYEAVKTESMKADVTFKGAGLKGQTVTYMARGGKQYTSFDLPGAGKFESGSDGATAWERSVILGPRLVPKSQAGGGMTGVGPDQVLNWTNAYGTMETVSKEEVNGAPCYLVKMTPKQGGEGGSSMCFDAQTGYLVKLTTMVKTQMGQMSFDCILSDYRQDGPLKNPHHLETKAAGQPISIDVTETVVNGPVPDGIFELPNDVRALKEKQAVKVGASNEPTDRPTLRHRK